MIERIRSLDSNLNIANTSTVKMKEIVHVVGKDREGIDPKSITAVNDLKQKTITTVEQVSRGKLYDSILILCIGSAGFYSGADNLGPLIGSMLEQKAHIEGIHVYGTMKSSLHAQNLECELKKIFERHKKPFVIGVDCLVTKKNEKVGLAFVKPQKLQPGKGVMKALPSLGDVEVTAALVHEEKDDTLDDVIYKLFSADRNIVKYTAEIIATGIYEALEAVMEQGVILMKP